MLQSGDVRENSVVFRELYHVVELQLSHVIWAINRNNSCSFIVWLLNGDRTYRIYK